MITQHNGYPSRSCSSARTLARNRPPPKIERRRPVRGSGAKLMERLKKLTTPWVPTRTEAISHA